MKGKIYKIYYLRWERTFMDVADTDRTRLVYDKKEDAIRALKKKIEEWTKSKAFATGDVLKVDKSDDVETPTFYIEGENGDTIFAEILEDNVEITY